MASAGGTNTVQILITMDADQAKESLGVIKSQILALGLEGSTSIKHLSSETEKLGGHAITALNKVQLLRGVFGIQIPRAMERAIASSQMLMKVVAGISGYLIGLGALEIGVHIFESLQKGYEKWLSVGAAYQAYEDAVAKHKDEDYINVRSLEDADLRWQQVADQAKSFKETADDLSQMDWGQILGGGNLAVGIGGAVAAHLGAAAAAKQAAGLQTKADAIDPRKLELQHQLNLEQITLNHAKDDELGKEAQITQHLQKQLAVIQENRDFQNKMSARLGNPVAPDSGKKIDDLANATAEAEAQVKRVKLNQSTEDAIRKMRDETAQIGLKGEALLMAEEKTRADGLSANDPKRIAMEQQLQAKILGLHRTTDDKIRQMQDEADLAGLTGAARVYAEEKKQLDDIARAYKATELTQEQADQERTIAAQKANALISASLDAYHQKVQLIVDGNVSATMSGYARITAEHAKATAQALADFQKEFGGLTFLSAQYLQARQDLNRQLGQIDAEAASKRVEQAQRNNQTILQFDIQAVDAEARVREGGLNGWVATYKDAVNKILVEEQRRMAQLAVDARKEGLTDQQVQQARQDIYRTANANIEEQNLQLRNQLASNLQSAFSNPVSYIKQKMQQMLYEIIANWIMQLSAFKAIFGAMGNGSAGGGIGGFLGKLLNPGGGGGVGIGGGGGADAGNAFSGGDLSQGAGAAYNPADPGSFGGGSSMSASSMTSLSAAMGTSGGEGTSALATAQNGGAFNPAIESSSLTGTGAAAGGLASTLGRVGMGLGGAYTEVTSLVNAYQNQDMLGGMLGGAEGGAMIGTAILPGIGTVLGAAAGAVAGFLSGMFGSLFGDSKHDLAKKYYNKTITPEIAVELARYEAGAVQWQQAETDLDALGKQELQNMQQKFDKDSGTDTYNKYVVPAIQKAKDQIEAQERGGRSFIAMQTGQFHSGGPIHGFGNMWTSGNEGFIHAMVGEHVVNPLAASQHRPVLNAMNSGADASSIASMYLAGSRRHASSTGSSGEAMTVHLTVHAIDAQSFEDRLNNGGLMDAIARAANRRTLLYSGEGNG